MDYFLTPTIKSEAINEINNNSIKLSPVEYFSGSPTLKEYVKPITYMDHKMAGDMQNKKMRSKPVQFSEPRTVYVPQFPPPPPAIKHEPGTFYPMVKEHEIGGLPSVVRYNEESMPPYRIDDHSLPPHLNEFLISGVNSELSPPFMCCSQPPPAMDYRLGGRPVFYPKMLPQGYIKTELQHSMDHGGIMEPMNGGGGSQGDSSGRSSPLDPAPNKMFVGGLSWQTTPEKLREYFGAYGTVKDVLIMKDPVTQRSRGFGFITFGDPTSVEKVMSVPSHILDNKKIDPKHATPKNRGRTNRTKKIFVGGVSQDTSADEVKGYFSQFGKVEEAVMLMDNQTKRHRGFGFVTFECEDVVERVCEIHFHTIKNKKVECKKAQPKEAVQAASLLSKRLMVTGGLTNPALVQVHNAQIQAAAIANAQAAALNNYGKLISSSSYPQLSAYRYAPYPLPTTPSTGALQPAPGAGMTHAFTHAPASYTVSPLQTTHTQPPPPPPTTFSPPSASIPTISSNPVATLQPYQGYSLANVDMSSFQGVDWSAMYGVGMYA